MDLHMINERISPFLEDFEAFSKFIEEERPVLSAKRGVLGKNDCFKLNSKLNYKKLVTAPNYNQDQYFMIDLLFSLVVSSNLYIVINDEKGKASLGKTIKMESFLTLNDFEKYAFLLETYWSKYEFDIKYRGLFSLIGLYTILKSIAQENSGSFITKERNTGFLFSEAVSFLHHLFYLGLCNLEIIEGVKSMYEDSIKSIIPSEFGRIVCRVLLTKGLSFWNVEDIEIIIDYVGQSKAKTRDEKLFSVIANIFPDKLVKKTVECEIQEDKSGVYIFKVSLSNRLWRKIKMSHKNTFEDLHLAIQNAFEFDDDHMYEFYIGGTRKTAKVTYTGNPYEGIEDDVSFSEARLYKGQKFKYIFDFGDMWEFDILVVDIDNTAALPIIPEIIEVKGDAPEQY